MVVLRLASSMIDQPEKSGPDDQCRPYLTLPRRVFRLPTYSKMLSLLFVTARTQWGKYEK
jgi:hypothetical protein